MTSKEIILEQLNDGYLDLDTTGYKDELEYIKNLIKAFEILKEKIRIMVEPSMDDVFSVYTHAKFSFEEFEPLEELFKDYEVIYVD